MRAVNFDRIEQALQFVIEFLKDRKLDAVFSISIEFQPYAAYNEVRNCLTLKIPSIVNVKLARLGWYMP